MLYALAHMLRHVCFQRHDFGIFLHLVVRTVESLSRMGEAPHWLALALVSTWPWIYPFLERIYFPQSLWMLYQSPWQKFSLWCVNEGGCIGKGSDNWAAGSSGLSHAVGQVWVWLSIRLWHKIWIWDHLIVHRIRDSVKAVDTPITRMPSVCALHVSSPGWYVKIPLHLFLTLQQIFFHFDICEYFDSLGHLM